MNESIELPDSPKIIINRAAITDLSNRISQNNTRQPISNFHKIKRNKKKTKSLQPSFQESREE
jgi:hypothetical protein